MSYQKKLTIFNSLFCIIVIDYVALEKFGLLLPQIGVREMSVL